MSRIHRLTLLFSVALAAGVAGSGTAQAAELLHAPTTVLDGTLTAAPGTDEAVVIARTARPRGRGHRSVDVAGPGKVTVELAGDSGDWDVACSTRPAARSPPTRPRTPESRSDTHQPGRSACRRAAARRRAVRPRHPGARRAARRALKLAKRKRRSS